MTTAAPLEDRSVTVVIATVDRPKLLRRALDGVLAQDHDAPVEVVVVFDNREPDHSLEMDDGRTRIRVVQNMNTQGLAGSRNTGVAEAKHTWIAFCDDDDEWLPGKLAAQFEALASTPGTELATTGIFIYFQEEDKPRIPDPAKVNFSGFLKDRMTEVHPSATLASADLVRRIGPVDEEIPGGYAEDYDWILRASKLSTWAIAGEPLVRVYWHGGSYFFERWKMIDQALEYLVDKYPEFADEPEGLGRIRGQQAVAQAAMKDRRRALKTCAQILKLNPLEPRVPVAALVALGVPAGSVLKTAHRFGKGI